MRTIGSADTHGEINAVASGAITKGIPVVVNTDGTVSAVAGTYRNSSFGTAVQIDGTNNSTQVTGCMIGSGKFVVAYRKSTDSKGYAKVGTISGTSITFGSEFNFSNNLAATLINVMYISSVDRIVFAYQENTGNNIGRIVVATPNTSTNTFDSLSTHYQIHTTNTHTIDSIALAYDAEAPRIICVYRATEDGHSRGRPFKLNTSDNSLTLGTLALIPKKPATGGTGIHAQYPCGLFDTQNNNTVFLFADEDNSGIATAVQGYVTNVSGAGTMNWSATTTPLATGATGHSSEATACVLDTDQNKGVFVSDGFGGTAGVQSGLEMLNIYSRSPDSDVPQNGSILRFNADLANRGQNGQKLGIAYDSTAEKIIVFMSDQASNRKEFLKNFYRADTDLDFFSGSYKIDVVLYNDDASGDRTVFYDSVSDQCVILYHSNTVDNETGSAYSVAQTYQNPRATATKKVTTANFLGFAKSGAANGDRVTVQTQGSIIRNKSGLVAGSEYYVQSDGSLQTVDNWIPVNSASTTKVLAGTAISATELKVKE